MIADPADELARAICVIFVNFAGSATVEKMASRPWASITFSGARHQFTLRLQGPSAREATIAFLAGLGERELSMRGHILADLAARGDLCELGEDCVCLGLEALTVEEAC